MSAGVNVPRRNLSKALLEEKTYIVTVSGTVVVICVGSMGVLIDNAHGVKGYGSGAPIF